MTHSQPRLRLGDVSLTIGDGDATVQALDHVDLTVAEGELLAIIGPSGSGKSSLLAVAGALATPTDGAVSVLGHDLRALAGGRRGKHRLAEFRLKHMGFVFQTGNLVPALTSLEQLQLVRRMSGGRGGFDPLELLDSVGMTHKADRRPHELSGGERQRVGIARSLVNEPGLLLVDEPTASLDRARSHDIVELLARQSHDRGVATVMVTHDRDVLPLCDRVLEMVDGRLAPVDAEAA